MTWTEGVTQISDTIFIGCGYSGLILSVVFILISIITIILLGLVGIALIKNINYKIKNIQYGKPTKI